MSPSKAKYKEALQAAKDVAYNRLHGMPAHFNERQERIFNQKLSYFKHQFDYWESVNDDLYLVYTGKTAKEFHGED